MAREPRDLVAEVGERAPARRQQLPVRIGKQLELVSDALRIPALRHLREPFELRVRQAERLADVADRTAAAVRRERRDECRVVAAVAFRDGDDQLLANVTRKIEVDVGNAGEVAVQEPAEREVGLDRIDMRETGQVADERADR